MKFKFTLLLLFILHLSCRSQMNLSLSCMPGLKQTAYVYKDTCRNIDGRFQGCSPYFLIYPDAPCNKAQAEDLIQSLGIENYARDYSGTVCVMNPVNGKQYDDSEDFQAFVNFQNRLRVISNLKVIGIGNGATFVNRTVAKNAGAVAGIVSINGEPCDDISDAPSVPVFVAGRKSDEVASAYIKLNDAKALCRKEGLAFYANERDSLIQVVVDNHAPNNLREVFDKAWKHLLSKNYRYNNYKHTWYTGASFGQYGPYELEPYIILEDLGITRNIMIKDLTGSGDYLWYEYHPKTTMSAKEGSVPLLLLLHGNNNDPRTQAETSGFIELSAKENFMVAELEWQGNGFAPMGLDGIEQVVYHLLKSYPQLDASRIYVEGLSAGAATATGLGIRKSHLFAGIGAQSAGLTPNRYRFGYNEIALMNEARQKRGWVEMPYFSIAGTDDEVVPFINKENWRTNAFFCARQAYQTMNGMDVPVQPDFDKDSTFGIELSKRESLHTNKDISMETGILYKDSIPLIKLVAVNDYGHWNFKPGAQLMWDFFKHFSRDVNTKRLVYHEELSK